jgi:hypothetical protein
MDIQSFRTDFPEFADTALYPDPMIRLWGEFAERQVNEHRWGDQHKRGVQLYTAHEITIEARDLKAGNIGGTPGQTGLVNSKTVGSVTVAYDTQSTIEKDAGWWNLTTYGRQFIRLARIFGVGAIQL